MSDTKRAWWGAVCATAFLALTAGPLMLGAGWTLAWLGAGIGQELGLLPLGWRISHGPMLIWIGAGAAAPVVLAALYRFFRAALAAERRGTTDGT